MSKKSFRPPRIAPLQRITAESITDPAERAALDLAHLKKLLNYPIVLDGRNLYSREQMANAGLYYYSMGRAPLELSHPLSGERRVAEQKSRVAEQE